MGRKKKSIETELDNLNPDDHSYMFFDGNMGVKKKSRFHSTANDLYFYNYDITPFQHPLLKTFGAIDPNNYYHREIMFFTTGFLRNISVDIIWEIIRSGWKYNNNIEIDWDDQLKLAVTNAVGLSLVVGSCFLLFMGDDFEKYQIFTPNDVYRAYYNENRQITEVYFRIDKPSDGKCVPEDPKTTTSSGYFLGALTQFAEEDERSNKLDKNKKIYKNCIMIIPLEDMKEPLGSPYLYNEVIIAIQKIYLRFYQMLYLHKGGMSKMLFMPPANGNIKSALERSMKRGFMNLGEIIFMDMNEQLNASNAIKYQETPTPVMPFEQIEFSINGEAMLSQQGITGSSESNNLSGTASVVNDINDSVVTRNYQMFLTKTIKDINFIKFNIDPKSYSIIYNEIDTQRKLEKIESKSDSQNENLESESHGVKYFDPVASFFDLANKMGPNSIYQIDPELGSILSMPEIASHHRTMIKHSINDEYVDFEVNLFKAGTYKYPERGSDVFITYTKEDIRKFTERDLAGRTGYLDLDHESKISDTIISEGIGWWETVGFDESEEKDITIVHLRKNIWEELGKPEEIKVSPRFIKKNGPNGTDIAVIDVAVLLKTIPRGELTGLKTEGKKIPK